MEESQPADGVPGRWVLLAYRMPREPSAPRIAVWRKLERLGVARLGDGLVALPADARTREQIDWLAEEIGEGSGSATVWVATPSTVDQERQIAATMQVARAAEYQTVIDEAAPASTRTPPSSSSPSPPPRRPTRRRSTCAAWS